MVSAPMRVMKVLGGPPKLKTSKPTGSVASSTARTSSDVALWFDTVLVSPSNESTSVAEPATGMFAVRSLSRVDPAPSTRMVAVAAIPAAGMARSVAQAAAHAMRV
jgi:hypothetical protein